MQTVKCQERQNRRGEREQECVEDNMRKEQTERIEAEKNRVRGESFCVLLCVLECLTFELRPDWSLELSPFASGSLSAHLQH